MSPEKKIGPKTVAMTNHLERTRSRYSRLTIGHVLTSDLRSWWCTSPLCLHGLDGDAPHLMQKDVVQ